MPSGERQCPACNSPRTAMPRWLISGFGNATACINDVSTNPALCTRCMPADLCALHVDIRVQTHALVIGLGGVRISPPLPFRTFHVLIVFCVFLFFCCVISFVFRLVASDCSVCLSVRHRVAISPLVSSPTRAFCLHTLRQWRPRPRAPLRPIFILVFGMLFM